MAKIDTDVPRASAPAPEGNDPAGASTSSPDTPTSASRPPSVLNMRLRSLSRTFEESDLPGGFLAATGSIASSVISTPGTHRKGSVAGRDAGSTWLGSATGGVSSPQEADERAIELPLLPGGTQAGPTEEGAVSGPRRDTVGTSDQGTIRERERTSYEEGDGLVTAVSKSASTTADPEGPPRRTDTAPFDNGYHFPPSHGFWASFKLGAVAFGKFAITPLGFLVVIYGLLVVAFGGQIFLLLCNAAPAMCHPTCDHIDSPRRKWIEYDSQILNALFCVTGFGLAPWRFRDLYFLMRYRVRKDERGLRRLAGIHRGWFRLAGSQDLPNHLGPKDIEGSFDESMASSVPYPTTSIPDAPLTGSRAPPTKLWKLDMMIWAQCWNTIMQALLAGFMWGMNRYDRPSWSTGLWVALAIIFAAVGGLIMFFEGKRVKGIEGVPLSDADRERLARDRELNIPHYVSLDRPFSCVGFLRMLLTGTFRIISRTRNRSRRRRRMWRKDDGVSLGHQQHFGHYFLG